MGYYSAADQLDRCERCGEYLTGRQERYCSPACRQAAHRARNRPAHVPMKPCALCGELFEPLHHRQKFCNYADEAGTECQAMQDDLEEAAWLTQEARKEARCAHCSKPAGWIGRGRPRRFCSRRCKQADYRKRVAQQAA